MGCRHAHSGQPVDDPCKRRWQRVQASANVAEEIVDNANAMNDELKKFGGGTSMIWDSGAGRNICSKAHVPDYTLSHSDHPGFTGPSGENIKVNGRARVHFTDEVLGCTADAAFIVANKVTRPILSGGDINDQGNITISGSKGAFVVSEDVAREACEALMPHAKLVFSRAGPGRLYEHNSKLLPQPDQIFQRQAAE